MTEIRKNVVGLTVGELKEMIEDIDNSTEIDVFWYTCYGVDNDKTEIVVETWDFPETKPSVTIEIGTYQSY